MDSDETHPLITRFLQQLTGRSAALTVAAYQRDLAALQTLAGDTDLTALSTAQLRRFLASQHARGLGPRSLARMLSAWRQFFQYLLDQEALISSNPCSSLRPPKSGKPLPKALSPDEAVRLAEIPVSDGLSARDRAMVELFYSSGLRLSELIGLAPGDVRLDEGMVRVLGKGDKTREVPVGGAARQAIAQWLTERANIVNADPAALFVGPQGKRLNPRTLQLRMKALAIRQGLSRHVHPHMLRHSMASHVLQSSGDLRAVQEMLGHASIAATQVYTHLDFQYLSKIYDAAHPRAKKK